jgi:NAD(P) transhydrogenase
VAASQAPVDPFKAEVSRVATTSIGVALLIMAGLGAPASFVGGLLTFSLSVIVGYYVVWGVTHALHSPLMSVTNAISGLVVVGGMMVSGGGIVPVTASNWLAAGAMSPACCNIFGGLLVTQRMLNMFRRPTDPPEYLKLWAIPALGVVAALTYSFGYLGLAHTYEIGYVVASLFCISSLAALSSQTTARLGVWLGMLGVGWGVASAAIALIHGGIATAVFMQMGACAAVGGAVGLVIAKSISPMDLPQLVAAFHSLVGLAAVLVAISSHLNEVAHFATDPMAAIHKSAIFFGLVIGGITFTGSIIAYLKLDGRLRSGALAYSGRDFTNIAMLVATIGLAYMYFVDPSMTPLYGATAISFVAGWHLVDAVGGADMPVCITVLNSYSGWALVAEGFMMNNSLLTVVGSLIGASGAILTYIMCVAMNRSIWNVLFGSYADLGADDGEVVDQGVHKEATVDDVANMIVNGADVMIVPGFGLCQGQAQYAVAEMCQILIDAGIRVRFGIHPVAGRMPGQLNVLLAEAGVPYDWVFEMDEINDDFPEVDVSLVIGANDVVNPEALDNPKSALAGMPVLHVWKAKQSVVFKRSMATGYAGVQNPLFFKENNWMLFGNAKNTCEQLRDACKAKLAQ